MKKFNLKKAIEGAEVRTINGDAVKILTTERASKRFPIVALLNENDVYCYTAEGYCKMGKTDTESHTKHPLDLALV